MDLNATPGADDANSYSTVEDATDYWSKRAHPETWDDADDQEAALVTATRMLDALFSRRRKLIIKDKMQYYLIAPMWNGTPTFPDQRLAFPRTGLVNRNGQPLDPTVIPIDLKFATAELAGYLAKADRLQDNDVAVQGITAVKAGSVGVNFSEYVNPTHILPSVVYDLLVPSWYTDERMEPVYSSILQVL